MAGNTLFKRKGADLELSPSKNTFTLKSQSPKFPSEASYLFSRPEENKPVCSGFGGSLAFGVMTGGAPLQLQFSSRNYSNEFPGLSRCLRGWGRL